ncbi:MAG: DNA-binding NtrC family response regulator [Hyphomicrobiaceae bacterium]|jgi:DNA-binding NtrC family response regulator
MARIAFFSDDRAVATALEAVVAGHDLSAVRDEISAADFDLIVVDSRTYPHEVDRLLVSGMVTPLLLIASHGAQLPTAAYERSTTSIVRLPFDLFELRVKIRSLLATAPDPSGQRPVFVAAGRPASHKENWVESGAIARARSAVRVGGPATLIGEHGVGRGRLARQLAYETDRRFHVWSSDDALPLDELNDGQALVWIPAIDRRSPADLSRLTSALDGAAAIVVAGARSDLDERVADGNFNRDLYYRLSAALVFFRPLRERLGEFDELVPAMLADLASRADLKTVELSPRAMDMLRSWSWPGNIVELEAVLLRSVARATSDEAISGGHLSDGHLIVDTTRLALAPELPSDVAPEIDDANAPTSRRAVVVALDDSGRRTARISNKPDRSTPPVRDASLDLLVAGLAHDLRNPLSTIKTFASLTARSEDGDSQLATLAAEACDRIDGELDLLHLYCDLPETGDPTSIELVEMFEEALLSTARDESTVANLDAPSEPVHARMDADFARFIAGCLIAQAAAGGSPLPMRLTLDRNTEAGATCRFEMRLPASADAASALERIVDSGDSLPWRLALAANVARRAGGTLEIQREAAEHKLTLVLPALEADEEKTDAQQARRSDRR